MEMLTWACSVDPKKEMIATFKTGFPCLESKKYRCSVGQINPSWGWSIMKPPVSGLSSKERTSMETITWACSGDPKKEMIATFKTGFSLLKI